MSAGSWSVTERNCPISRPLIVVIAYRVLLMSSSADANHKLTAVLEGITSLLQSFGSTATLEGFPTFSNEEEVLLKVTPSFFGKINSRVLRVKVTTLASYKGNGVTYRVPFLRVWRWGSCLVLWGEHEVGSQVGWCWPCLYLGGTEKNTVTVRWSTGTFPLSNQVSSINFCICPPLYVRSH